MLCTTASPRPVPRGPLVEKNGSNICLMTFPSMPMPVSSTVSLMWRPEAMEREEPPTSTLSVLRVIFPPPGMASLAFITRFIIICSMLALSDLMRPMSGAREVLMTMFSLMRRLSMRSVFVILRFRSSGGCLRRLSAGEYEEAVW